MREYSVIKGNAVYTYQRFSNGYRGHYPSKRVKKGYTYIHVYKDYPLSVAFGQT